MCSIASDTSSNSIGTLNPFRYRGYYFDTETELYYLQSRYYDPWLRRFISADAAEMLCDFDKSSFEFNIYSYCDNDPVSNDDQEGHKKTKVKKVKKVGNKNKTKVNEKYNRKAALEYARKWYNKRNKDFYDGDNGDCGNFVSQCMNAGGISMNNKWKCVKKGNVRSWVSRTLGRGWSFGYDYTDSWGLANAHYNFFEKSCLKYRKYTIYNENQINNVNKWGIRPGDIVYYYEKNHTTVNHVAIVSRINGPKSPIEVAQHSKNYLYRDTKIQLRDCVKIVIIRINDNIMNWNTQ